MSQPLFLYFLFLNLEATKLEAMKINAAATKLEAFISNFSR
jgi:hypothetical protein